MFDKKKSKKLLQQNINRFYVTHVSIFFFNVKC